MIALGLPALVSLILTTALEGLLMPRPQALWRRPLSCVLVHLGTWGIHYTFWIAVVQRPWFALVIHGALQLVIIQVNNVKSASLREPFLYQDFDYFIDAIRHPRLYVPFFGIKLTIAASLAGLAAIVTGFALEPSLFSSDDWGSALFALAGLGLLSLIVLRFGLIGRSNCTLDITFNPSQDLVRQGLFAYLWAYGLLARRPLDDTHSPVEFTRLLTPSTRDAKRLPHVIAVQSESFFDPRPWHDGINPEVLSAYDRLSRQALSHGRLQVPAWGANTVRTESAFLTGLTPEALGVHRFNPYSQLSRRPMPNLASQLALLGYRTLCIHPYPASFYLRDKVYPRLGFEGFLDIEAFSTADKQGQYIGDMALAHKVKACLMDADPRPLFVFVISMENHGPLHLERPDPASARRWYRRPPPQGCDDLTVYLRHLHNADRMIDSLATMLEQASRPGLLCWYGDHVPIMPKVYARLGEPDGLTDYLLWSTTPQTGARHDALCNPRHDAFCNTRDVQPPLAADALGVLLLDTLLDISASPPPTGRAVRQPATNKESP
nr:LTA synthase family protein [uncultured Halomonas sp.]